MSIFDVDNPVDPPGVIEAKRLMNQGNEDFNYLVTAHINAFRDFWYNESGCTPEEIAEGFGIQGTKVMQMAYARVQYLLSVDPNCLPEAAWMPPREIIYNPDGSIALTPVG